MNRRSSYVFFLLWSSNLLASLASSVHIGAIVNTNSRIGREQKIALEISAQQFNSSSSILFLDVNGSSSSDSLEESAIVAQNLISSEAEVIVSTGTWPEVLEPAKIGNRSKVPVISLAADPPPSTLFPIPYLVQMSYPSSCMVGCLADVVKSYNWRRVIVIYEDDEYGSMSGAVVLLSDFLRAVGTEVDYHLVFPPLDALSDPKATVLEMLQSIPVQTSNVFIVFRSSETLAMHLFQQAKELKMMEKDHAWIVNDDIAGLLDSAFSPSFISSYMQGVIGIRTYFNQSTNSFQDFSSKFRQRFQSEYQKNGEYSFDPGMYAVRAFDAVDAIARGSAQALRNNSTLLKGILSSDFTGLSGLIRFNGDESLPEGKSCSVFQILNVVGRSYRELGFWLNGYGLYKDDGGSGRRGTAVDALGPVFWPGLQTKVPGGWGKLRIGVPNYTASEFVNVEYEGGKVKDLTGYCMDVFYEVLKNLKYGLIYEFIPFGGNYDDLVNLIRMKKVDAVVGDITILSQRSVNATFTQPYMSSELCMVVPVKKNGTPWVLTKPFSKGVWLLFLATLIYTGTLVWYLEHKCNPAFNGSWQAQFGVTVWLISCTIFFTHGKIYNCYSRAIILVWLVLVLVLTSSFTANLSSILTIEKLEPVKPGSSMIGCDGSSFVLKYLQEVLGYKKAQIVTVTAENMTLAFQKNLISAAYVESPYLKIFLSQNADYTVYGQTYRLGGFGFVFPEDSPLANDFSQVILQLSENGTLNYLEKKWFSFSLTMSPTSDKNKNKDSLSLESFWGLFLFTGGTSMLVFLLFQARSLGLIDGGHISTAFRVCQESMRRLSMNPRCKRSECKELDKVHPISSDGEDGTVGIEQAINCNIITVLHDQASNGIQECEMQNGNHLCTLHHIT